MTSPVAVFGEKVFLGDVSNQDDFDGFSLDVNMKPSELTNGVNAFSEGQIIGNDFVNITDGFDQIITQGVDSSNFQIHSNTTSPHIGSSQLESNILIPPQLSNLEFDFNMDTLISPSHKLQLPNTNSDNSAADNEHSSVENSCSSFPTSERKHNRRVGRGRRSSANSPPLSNKKPLAVGDRRKRGRPKRNSIEQTTSSGSSTNEHSQDDESGCQSQPNSKKLKGTRSANSIESLVINNREHHLSKLITSENDPAHSPASGAKAVPSVLAVSNQNSVVDELLNSAVTNGKEAVKSAVSDQVISALISEAAIKRVRLARKAELARLSRCKKKSRLNELEEENQRLKTQIEEFQKQQLLLTEEQLNFKKENASNTTTKDHLACETTEVTAQSVVQPLDDCIDRLLEICKSPNSAYLVPMNVKQLLAVQSRNNLLLSASISILKSVRNNGLPIYSSFLMWILSRNDHFVNDPAGLWKELWNNHLKISAEQITKLIELRTKIQKKFQNRTPPLIAQPYQMINDCNFGQGSTDVFTKMIDQLLSQQMQSNDNLQFLADLLNPEQLIAYFRWVKQFGHVCIKINQ